ncbi:hypothetical protein IWW55_002560, partial [Coemansia sp. RSA 2706]
MTSPSTPAKKLDQAPEQFTTPVAILSKPQRASNTATKQKRQRGRDESTSFN